MAKTLQRKLWAVELWDVKKKRWGHTNFGGFLDDHDSMLNSLREARTQYPNEKYKLTTFVPDEPARKTKKKTKRRKR